MQQTYTTHMQMSTGETFLSDTDTEVIPKLCRYLHNNRTKSKTFVEVCCVGVWDVVWGLCIC